MRKIAMVASALLLLATAAFALQSESASYRTRTEAVTQAGGGSSSANNLAAQQALGQSAAGSQSSTNYIVRAGVVQPVAVKSTSPSGWQLN